MSRSSHRSHDRPGGRHELGQNFLVDRAELARFTALVRATDGPLVELAAGDGALTAHLARLGRPVTAVELDPAQARRLEARRMSGVRVIRGDLLRVPLPAHPHVVVANLPFHLTTAAMRRLLDEREWTDAVLLVQWEVARRRAGVGGGSLLTASWLPWYAFELHGRVPARAFRPVPAVDGGLLVIRRRPLPLVRDRVGYQRMVDRAFRATGRRIDRVAAGATGLGALAVQRWMSAHGIRRTALPRDLDAAAWTGLWRATGRR